MDLIFDLPRHCYFELLDGNDAEPTQEFHLWLDEHHINCRLHKSVTRRDGSWFASNRMTCMCRIEFFFPADAMLFRLRWL